MSELENKLTELKRLLDMGLIDQSDFDGQKKALLAAAVGGAPLGGETRVESSVDLPDRLGSYRVLGTLGEGGMGTVLRARHAEEGWARRQGGDVAIKLIQPHIARDPGFRERFFAEAELGRKVSHDSVATVFDVLADGDHLGTVMSLVEGRELTTFVRPGGLPLSEVVALLRPLAQALDHLHGLGIIHRDLKPANVKVRADGTPVLLDLGIAKDMTSDANHTATATAMGTAGWMAPEQADAKNVGPAADRYALGGIAYALLSGRMPWADGASAARILTHKLGGNLVPLSQVSAVSAHTSQAVMKMLSLDPSARPSRCVAFVNGLQPTQALKPKPKPPEKAVYEPKVEAPAPISKPDVEPTEPETFDENEFNKEMKTAVGVALGYVAVLIVIGVVIGIILIAAS
ncbi:MAG: serine/threonine protein kinase [Proteobacteria bacterium]|nr:serine/threonine protein kinase [Pseudomonadota bacterium]MCP4916000.1 serine/threonine protein kinase [Pseudomonadota bacterium]